ATTAAARPEPAAPAPEALDIQERLMAIVRTLADPKWEGRGVGTAGLDSAARYLAVEMAARGLSPAGDAGAHDQRLEGNSRGGPGRAAGARGPGQALRRRREVHADRLPHQRNAEGKGGVRGLRDPRARLRLRRLRRDRRARPDRAGAGAGAGRDGLDEPLRR